MSKLGICVAVLVATVGTARAQAPGAVRSGEPAEVEIEDPADAPPPPPSAYDQCMATRESIAARAASTTNIGERTRLYQSMPECHPGPGEHAAARPVAPLPVAAAPVVQPSLADPPEPNDAQPDEIPELKSPAAAFALSLGTTLAGLVVMSESDNNKTALTAGVVMFVVGPTTGHIYAGAPLSAGLGLRIVGAGAATLGLFEALSHEGTDGSSTGAGLFVCGSLLYIGATMYEIGSAPGAARAYNRKRAYKLVPVASQNAGGVSLIGSF